MGKLSTDNILRNSSNSLNNQGLFPNVFVALESVKVDPNQELMNISFSNTKWPLIAGMLQGDSDSYERA